MTIKKYTTSKNYGGDISLGGSGGLWVVDASRLGGTFILLNRKTQVGGEAKDVSSISTDSPNIIISIIGERSSEYEPIIKVNGVLAVRDNQNNLSVETSGVFKWTATVSTSSTLNISSNEGGLISIPILKESPAIVSNLLIVNNPNSSNLYPINQTEVKSGDPIFIDFETDKDIKSIQVLQAGAGMLQDINVTVGKTFSGIQVTCGSLGITSVLRDISIQTTTVSGAVSTVSVTSLNKILCNDLYPSVVFDEIIYPTGQGALKGSEQANIPTDINNSDMVLFSSPNGQLNVVNPNTSEGTKVVERVSGDYNDSIVNYSCLARRFSNGSQVTSNLIVIIADSDPVITVNEPSPMKSGGNDGTSLGNYTITLNSTQRLIEAPTLTIPEGTLTNFNWSNTAKSFTATISVSDYDTKGLFNYGLMIAKSLSGITQNSISGDATFEFKGIKTRTVPLPPFGTMVTINAALQPSNESNITINWNFIQKDLTYNVLDELVVDGFTILNNTGTSFDIKILDAPRAASSSQESTLIIGG